MDQRPNPYWHFFLAIEADLANTTRYVELSEHNFGTYSIEYAKILLSASSEVDVVCRVLAASLGVQPPPETINEHRQAILQHYPKFHRTRIDLPRYGLVLKPWSSWGSGESPPWWQAYNVVKHRRHSNYADANLGNALQSVAGLFALVLYLDHEDLFRGALYPWPSLLTIESNNVYFSPEDHYNLPDFGHFGAA